MRRSGAIRHPYDGHGRQSHPDTAIAYLARRQHGVVARRQLLELGLGRGAIESRLRAGRLHLIHRGVYAVGHQLVSQYGGWLAAVLAVGPGAFLSHLSAAALWRFCEVPRALIDVTVAAGSRRGPRSVRVHRTTTLAPDQTRIRFGIPVTSVNRTLLDLSLTLSGRALERAFDEADRLALVGFDELGRICGAAAGNPGAARLRKLAERRRLPHGETRSPLESRFLRFCRERGLPIPAVNVPVAGYEVDCLWRDARLVVALDSWAHHSDRDSFEADRRRDAASSGPASALSASPTER